MLNIDINLELVDIIRQYNFRVGAIESYHTFHILKSDRGPKVLTVWDDIEKLEKTFKYKELLAKNGFRKIDRFIRTKDGRPYVLFKNKGYALSDLIEGLPPSFNREKDLKKVGITLREYNLASAKLISDNQIRNWSYHFKNGLDNIDILEDKIKSKKDKNNIDEIIIKDISNIKKQIYQSIQMAKKVESNSFENKIKPIMCHGRFSLNSFKIDDYDETWIIDTGVPIIEMPSYDIAKFISDVYVKNGLNKNSIYNILDGYQEVKELTNNEKLWILTYTAYPHNIWKLLRIYSLGKIIKQDDFIKKYKQITETQMSIYKLYQDLFVYFAL